MDFAGGKRHDVVDIGGEVDYSGIQWFQDAPSRERPPESPPPPNYAPDPMAIDANNRLYFALDASANQLYSNYRQYGQLGVLAFCHEFGELIDNLKNLGRQGNMFISTRKRALEACTQMLTILRESMEIEMQIIVMYLCSQINRLRIYLDSDGHWEDYPASRFAQHTQYVPPFGGVDDP